MEKETGTAFPAYGGACEHFAPPPGYRPPPPGRRPRPVLERGIGDRHAARGQLPAGW
ncbi:hypothetical protein [Streptomyces lunaelactis]|uniref:hypothetical protein n=1 Tax=Streptomyces lunaelactis TaxID=1535768 RepID=UPI00131F3A2A|nr:hypothetical protein [Streptomyces lunaelactis]